MRLGTGACLAKLGSNILLVPYPCEDSYVKLPMAITAENLAEQHGITRQQADEFAIRSQHLWQQAHESGALIGISLFRFALLFLHETLPGHKECAT